MWWTCSPPTISAQTLARQLARSATSPYANYCAACLAKSPKDFLNKLKMVEEELDETSRWIELIGSRQLVPRDTLAPIYRENIQLLKIIVSSILTVRKSVNRPK